MQILAFLPFRVRPYVVLFRPERVGGVQVIEIRNQPGGIEDAIAQIARQAVEPAPTKYASEVPQGVLAMDAAPVGKRSTSKHDRPDQIRAHASGHHQVPAGLTIAEHEGLAQCWMEFVHLLDEDSKGVRHVLDTLSVRRVGLKTDKIDRMPRLERIADLADRLKAAYPRSLTGPGINDDDRTLAVVDFHSRRRDDSEQRVVNRSTQC